MSNSQTTSQVFSCTVLLPFQNESSNPPFLFPLILFLLIQKKQHLLKLLPTRWAGCTVLYSCQPVTNNWDLISTSSAGVTQEKKTIVVAIVRKVSSMSLWSDKLWEIYLRQEAQDQACLSPTPILSHPGPSY